MSHLSDARPPFFKFLGGAAFGGTVTMIGFGVAAGNLLGVLQGLITGTIVGGYVATAYEEPLRRLRALARRARAARGIEDASEFTKGLMISLNVLCRVAIPFLVLFTTAGSLLISLVSLASDGPTSALEQLFKCLAGAGWFLGVYTQAVVLAAVFWFLTSALLRRKKNNQANVIDG